MNSLARSRGWMFYGTMQAWWSLHRARSRLRDMSSRSALIILPLFCSPNSYIPILKQTAQTAPKNSIRVIWVASSAAQFASRPAIDLSNMDYKREEGIWPKYIRSKAGNVLHSTEFARRTKGEGIISLVGEFFYLILATLLIKNTYCYDKSLNPGNFMTNLQQTMPVWQRFFFVRFTLVTWWNPDHDPIHWLSGLSRKILYSVRFLRAFIQVLRRNIMVDGVYSPFGTAGCYDTSWRPSWLSHTVLPFGRHAPVPPALNLVRNIGNGRKSRWGHIDKWICSIFCGLSCICVIMYCSCRYLYL